MVAASGDTEGFSVRACAICLALILVGLVATVVLGAQVNVLRQTPFENSPEVLAKKARDLIQSFGYAEPPADRAYGFFFDLDYGKSRSVRRTSRRFGTGSQKAIRHRSSSGIEKARSLWRHSPLF